ncbi:MAG: nucleoside-diphosphate-sugar epimerase [Arenicella sp.]|jgi:nucleoside-diphosphate-sugar epimerase
MVKNQNTIIVYGGNGFVGTHVAEQLIARGASVTCASRSGQRPAHLANTAWADNVQWIKSDAGNPEPGLLSAFEVMISTIGSPPLPTFSQAAYNKQLLINGTCNVKAIECAGESGIKRLVLVGAKIPEILHRDGFAYAKGKRIALEAAQTFSSLSDEHRAIVIQSGAIFGTRYTPSGTKIPLGLIMGPLSKVFGSQLVSVEKLAKRIVDSSLGPSNNLSAFELIKHAEI